MRIPFALGLALLGVGRAAMGAAMPHMAAALEAPDGEPPLRKRGKGHGNKRGKGAARRHGRKLRSNRLIVSKRVRRKHRRG